MICHYFAIEHAPFSHENIRLLPQQQDILDIVLVHCRQGGLCLILGEPGTGKTAIRNALAKHDPKRLTAPTISRTLHSYFNILRILCQACEVPADKSDYKCERGLIEYARRIGREGKMLVPIVDDAHLMDIDTLRKLRLLCEEFPRTHNLVLIGQTPLLSSMHLAVNADIKSRVTYSVIVPKLNPDQLRQFILDQLDRVRLGHNAFTEEALELIVRASEGVIRRVRNLCIGAMVEAVRDKTNIVDLKQVNACLIQPHWRSRDDMEPR
jgi:MSHA biogenesis protein MshM